MKELAIPLIKDEHIIWKSYPGFNYRMFILVRDLVLAIAMMMVIKELIPSTIPDVFSDEIISKFSYIVLGLGLLVAAAKQISFLFIQYMITSERFIIKRGFISRKVTSIKLEYIHDTKVKQTVSDRLLKIGTLYVFTANDSHGLSDGPSFLHSIPSFQNIDDPFRVHQMLEQILEEKEDESKH